MGPNLNQNASTPLKPNPASNTLIVLLVILVFILVGSLGYVIFQNYILRNKVLVMQASLNPSPTPAGTDPNMEWKTYTNEKDGFEMKYPTDWRVFEDETSVSFGPLSIHEDTLFGAGKVSKIPSIGLDPANPNHEITKIENASINGLSAKRIYDRNISLNQISTSLYITHGGAILAIGQPTLNNSDYPFNHSYNTTIDQILSTFKFTGSSSDSNMIYLAKNIIAHYETGGISTTGDSANLVLSIPSDYKISAISETKYVLEKGNVKYELQTPSKEAGEGLCTPDNFGKDCTYTDTVLPNISTFRLWRDNSGNFAINPQSFKIDNYYLDYLVIKKLAPSTVFSNEEINFWKNLLAKIEIQKI